MLSERPGHVAVLDHVSDLSLHGEEEEDEEVYQQDGPEHGHVEHLEEGHEEADNHRLDAPVPELELGKTTSKGSEIDR